MEPLKFTRIREDNTVDEEEFEGSCEVIYRKERINLKNLNEKRLSESIDLQTLRMAFRNRALQQ